LGHVGDAVYTIRPIAKSTIEGRGKTFVSNMPPIIKPAFLLEDDERW
jgi:hypothetical protein